ncbi:MAG: hypothetical protein HY895_21485 [Deltaproteobacteria bacterium]|nr:hypothetical protein [Deltaproteobacteria bacterium]
MQVDRCCSTRCRHPENIPIDTALEIEQINLQGYLFLRGAAEWTLN